MSAPKAARTGQTRGSFPWATLRMASFRAAMPSPRLPTVGITGPPSRVCRPAMSRLTPWRSASSIMFSTNTMGFFSSSTWVVR